MTAYYSEGGITIHLGDCHSLMRDIEADVMVTDPPYGIAYNSGSRRSTLAASIEGDEDTSARDGALFLWGDRPALVFGTWRIPRPAATRARLVWDAKGALGMGDLSIPWKPSDQEIYVLGHGFHGPRTTNVLRVAPVQSTAKNGRQHPHEKPVPLMRMLIDKCPPGVILDPFMGSGSTLRAALEAGREAVGIEIDERYCEAAVKRLAQTTLDIAA